MDSGCTHMGINEQLVKEEKIKMKLVDISFKVFNVYGTKNALLEVEIDRHKE